MVLASGLAADDPRKQVLERAIVAELEATSEPWVAVLTVHPSHHWWSVKVTRMRDGFAQSLVIGENQQTEEAVRQSVRTAVKTADHWRQDRSSGNPEVF